jgi:hypothetical protein
MQLTGFKMKRPFRQDARNDCQLVQTLKETSVDESEHNVAIECITWRAGRKMQAALIGFGLEVLSALVGTPHLKSG